MSCQKPWYLTLSYHNTPSARLYNLFCHLANTGMGWRKASLFLLQDPPDKKIFLVCGQVLHKGMTLTRSGRSSAATLNSSSANIKLQASFALTHTVLDRFKCLLYFIFAGIRHLVLYRGAGAEQSVVMCGLIYAPAGMWGWPESGVASLFTSALSSLHLLAGTLLFRFSCFPHMPAHCGLLAELEGVPPCCSIPLFSQHTRFVAFFFDKVGRTPRIGYEPRNFVAPRRTYPSPEYNHLRIPALRALHSSPPPRC